MSLAGIVQFEKNLRTLVDSQAFKEADEGQRLRFGYSLLRSRYGVGSCMGLGPVQPLPEPPVQDPAPPSRR